jgi:chromosome segregation ATPase
VAARERLDALLITFTRGISSLLEERRDATRDTLSRLDALSTDLKESLATTREGLEEARAHRRNLHDMQSALTEHLRALSEEHHHLKDSLNDASQASTSAFQAHHADLIAQLTGTRGELAAALQAVSRLEDTHRSNHEAIQRALAEQTATLHSSLSAAAQRRQRDIAILGAGFIMIALLLILL